MAVGRRRRRLVTLGLVIALGIGVLGLTLGLITVNGLVTQSGMSPSRATEIGRSGLPNAGAAWVAVGSRHRGAYWTWSDRCQPLVSIPMPCLRSGWIVHYRLTTREQDCDGYVEVADPGGEVTAMSTVCVTAKE